MKIPKFIIQGNPIGIAPSDVYITHTGVPLIVAKVSEDRQSIDAVRVAPMGRPNPSHIAAIMNDMAKWYRARVLALTKPNSDSEYFHWISGDNILRSDQPTYLVNAEHGLIIRFDYTESVYSNYLFWRDQVADVQFIRGDRPSDSEVERILIEAWNFLALTEREEERLAAGMSDDDDDDFL